ncbi:MAG: hypothetical protein IKZ84_01800 [Victivallales bacterium]|nr:hypothetical protein [Victivallales bacterium]
MSRHNMSGMDAASKLLMANEAVAKDAINFILRDSGYAVVEGSMRQRNAEAVAKMPGLRNLYKKISNDIVWELDVTDGGPPMTILAAFENQSNPSCIMPVRGLLSTTVRMLAWRQATKDMRKARRELRSVQERFDGVLAEDRPTPVLPATVYFGQEAWPGKSRLHGMMELPEGLRSHFADCPSNLLSFRDMALEELSLLPIGAFRCVAICIRFADVPADLRREWETDPSFQLLDTMPDAALDVIYIATGFDLRKTNKEDNTMKKKMSTCEKFFRAEGEAIGEARGSENTIRNFIERKRNRHVPEEQIHEELLLDFGLDDIQAKQYMEPSLAKA